MPKESRWEGIKNTNLTSQEAIYLQILQDNVASTANLHNFILTVSEILPRISL
jgi:hypothetical protein